MPDTSMERVDAKLDAQIGRLRQEAERLESRGQMGAAAAKRDSLRNSEMARDLRRKFPDATLVLCVIGMDVGYEDRDD